MTSHKAVTIATIVSNAADDSLTFGLYGNHAYAVTGYNSATGKFTLSNPWGFDQPTSSLTWAQLKTVCYCFSVADAGGTTPLAPGAGLSATTPLAVPLRHPGTEQFRALAADWAMLAE